MEQTAIIWGVLFPVVVSTILFLLSWTPWNQGSQPNVGATGAIAVALLIAITVGYYMLTSEKPTWPMPTRTGQQRFLIAAILFLGIALADGALPIPILVRWPIRLAAVGAALFYVIKSKFTGSQSDQAIWWAVVAGLAVAIVLVSFLVEQVANTRTGTLIPIGMVIVSSAVSIAIVASGSLKIGQLAALVAAVLGPWIVGAILNPAAGSMRGGVFPAIVLCGLFMTFGAVFSDLPKVSFALLLIGFAAVQVLMIPAFTRFPATVQWFVVLILQGLLAGSAVLIAALIGNSSSPY